MARGSPRCCLGPRSIAFVSGDLSLFGDEPASEQVQAAPVEARIADWLVDSLREALTARGLTTMGERQEAIEVAVGRPVDALRSLTRAEALQALSQLAALAQQTRSTSRWDDRDEDTWIDRL